jgi:hypothetical protein
MRSPTTNSMMDPVIPTFGASVKELLCCITDRRWSIVADNTGPHEQVIVVVDSSAGRVRVQPTLAFGQKVRVDAVEPLPEPNRTRIAAADCV